MRKVIIFLTALSLTLAICSTGFCQSRAVENKFFNLGWKIAISILSSAGTTNETRQKSALSNLENAVALLKDLKAPKACINSVLKMKQGVLSNNDELLKSSNEESFKLISDFAKDQHGESAYYVFLFGVWTVKVAIAAESETKSEKDLKLAGHWASVLPNRPDVVAALNKISTLSEKADWSKEDYQKLIEYLKSVAKSFLK